MSGSIGSSLAQQFKLPTATTNSGVNYILATSGGSNPTTYWKEPPTSVTTSTSILFTAVSTSTTSTIETTRATNLSMGTYIITYQVEPQLT